MVNNPYENSVSRTGLVNRLLADRYEVLETLGEGALLTSYRARDKQANRIVTIKAVRSEFATDEQVLRNLREGISNAFSLAHSNIARVFDIGNDPESGLLYLAEEYVRGIDLKERIRRAAPFQLAPATDTAIAIAEALEAAHLRGVAHGDVRPQNILVGPEGQIKLTNFGTAPALVALSVSDPALLKRIVGYTAPDTARSSTPTASADIYSLGCLLFEMLTGDLPYPGENPMQIALKHAQEPIPSPRQINGSIPPALDGIVRKALEKTPERRYAAASEMLIDLKAVRDALRFGKPLNWTPRERENSVERSVSPRSAGPDTIPIPVPALDGDGLHPLPSVAPTVPPPSRPVQPVPPVQTTASGRTASPMPEPERAGNVATANVTPASVAPYAVEEERKVRPQAKGVQWLTLLNLFMAIVLVGAIGGLYWVIMSSNKPDAVVILPSLVGKSLIEAQQIAKEKNFEVAVVGREFRDNEPKDTIYQQNITAGRSIKPGKQVPVWVSDGPRMAIIPDVRQMAFERARKILERNGLSLGNVKVEYDPIEPKGNVLNQTPPAGENRPRGTKVELVLSRGEEPLPTPEPLPTVDTYPESTPTPEDTEAKPTVDAGAPLVRYFKVVYPEKPIRDGDEPHRVRIDVLDDEGPHTIKDDLLKPGQQLRLDHVKVVGERITIKVYDNDELKVEIEK